MSTRASGGPVARPGDVILGDRGAEFVATARWIAHQERCPHQQAEPVELITGERVACVCIACLGQLPANWITNQRDRAEREARCTHIELLTMIQMGVGVEKVCTKCGWTTL